MAQNRPARPAHRRGRLPCLPVNVVMGDGVTQKEIAPYRGRIIKRVLKMLPLRGVCARSALWDACVACRSKNCYIIPQKS